MDLQADPQLARLRVERESRVSGGSFHGSYRLWVVLLVISPARLSCIATMGSPGDLKFASAHMSFARAVSGSMSSSGTTPAFRRSLPVSYTFMSPLPQRHWEVMQATPPPATNFLTSSMFLPLMCPS